MILHLKKLPIVMIPYRPFDLLINDPHLRFRFSEIEPFLLLQPRKLNRSVSSIYKHIIIIHNHSTEEQVSTNNSVYNFTATSCQPKLGLTIADTVRATSTAVTYFSTIF